MRYNWREIQLSLMNHVLCGDRLRPGNTRVLGLADWVNGEYLITDLGRQFLAYGPHVVFPEKFPKGWDNYENPARAAGAAHTRRRLAEIEARELAANKFSK